MKLTTTALFTATMMLTSARAQAQTCGWDADELEGGLPRSVAAVAARVSGNDEVQATLVHVRQWVESCDATAARVATQTLRRMADQRRNDAALHALTGMISARGPEVQVEHAEGYLFRATYPASNAEKDARRRLASAARTQRWPEPARELAALALGTRTVPSLDLAAEVLAELAPADPSLWLPLAEVELARRNYAAAVAAAERVPASSLAGAQRIIGVARIMEPATARAGADTYLQGMQTSDAYAVQRYYEDLIPLLTREEVAAWKGLALEQKGPWLQKAWSWRASIAAVTPDRRLLEHFTRLHVAMKSYRRISFRTAAAGSRWLGDYTPPVPVDDRGLVYIRHGPADEYVSLSSMGATRMAWYYRYVDGGRAVLEFDKTNSAPDYFLADPTVGCQDSFEGKRAGSSASAARAVARYKERLTDWGAVFQNGCYGTIAGDSAKRQFLSGPEQRSMTIHSVLATESATPRMSRPLNMLVQSYAFRAGAGTELTTFAAIQAEKLTGTPTEQGIGWSISLYVAAEDAATHGITRTDTVISMRRATAFGQDDMILASVALLPPPSENATVRIGVRNMADTAQGQVSVLRKAIPRFAPRAFAMSDIVIAEPRDGRWQRGSVQLAPIAGHRVGAGASFRIFHELYGAAADEPLEVELVVAPGGATGALDALRALINQRQGLQLRFSEPANLDDDGIVRISREVGAELESGDYVLRVTVTRTRTGESVSSWTPLHIR